MGAAIGRDVGRRGIDCMYSTRGCPSRNNSNARNMRCRLLSCLGIAKARIALTCVAMVKGLETPSTQQKGERPDLDS